MKKQNETKSAFRFSIRQLLVFVSIAGPLFALTTHQFIKHRQSSTSAVSIEKLGGKISWNPELLENLAINHSFWRISDVNLWNPEMTDDLLEPLNEIPHRFGMHIEGSTFDNDAIVELIRINNLNYLVLNQTSVTQNAILKFQQKRPDVTVMLGYPGQTGFREYPSTN